MKRNRDVLEKYDKVIGILIKIMKILPKNVRYKILKYNRRNNSKLAILINYLCVKTLAKKCGKNVSVFSNVYLNNLENIEIGDNVSIHPMCYIEGIGGLKIGNNVSIAHSTSILTVEHNYSNLNLNIKDQGILLNRVEILDNVWVGCGARILSGVNIESGSIVGAGAVITKSVNRNSIVAGIPAKLIKTR